MIKPIEVSPACIIFKLHKLSPGDSDDDDDLPDDRLKIHFLQFGPIVEFHRYKALNKKPGFYGFVHFDSKNSAHRALSQESVLSGFRVELIASEEARASQE